MISTRCFTLRYIIAVVLICTIVTVASGSKILVINHVTLHSHLQLFNGILEELIPRGHNVTYLGFLPYTGPLKSKITQHPLTSKIISNRSSILRMMQDAIDPSTPSSYFTSVLTFVELHGKEPCTYLESDIITHIMNSFETFDVLILNAALGECFYSIGYMKGIPIILISATLPYPWQYTSIGIDPYFGIEKSILLHYPRESLIHRTLDLLLGNFILLYRYWMYASGTDAWLARNYPNVNFPPFHKLEKNISLLMVNSIPAMGYARSESPIVVNIGGLHVRPPKKLSNELEEFISASKTGFIYFSFGTSFQTDIVPKRLLNTFLEAFKQLPYRILMKWVGNSTSIPSNVLSSPWLPQQDILGDPRLRLFVTHGGMLSIQEVALYGVPVLLIPIFFEQFINARKAEELGYGIQLDIKTITSPLLVHKIEEVINNPRYNIAAQELSTAIRDVPNTPQELLIWWTEYVIRNGGTERLRTRRERLSWYQQQLDVILLLCGTTAAVLSLLYLVPYSIYNLMRRL